MMNLDISGKLKQYKFKLPLNLKRALLFPFKGAIKYLSAYFAGIVFFALIYNFNHDKFYYNTWNLEPSIIEGKNQLLDLIGKSIEPRLSQQFADDVRITPFKKLSLYVSANGPGVDNYNISLIALRSSWTSNEAKIIRLGPTPNYSTLKTNQYSIDLPETHLFTARLFPSGLGHNNNWKLPDKHNVSYCSEMYFTMGRPSICLNKDHTLQLNLGLSPETSKVYQKLKNAFDGKGAKDEHSFPRMLYFSVTTMTTLGYGDIVPLTNKMRMVVAIQTIFGIILLGTFLNSLASTRDK